MLLGPGLREVEGELEDAVDADAGHDGFLHHGLAVGAFEDLAADAGVFAFGVLPDDVEVDVAGLTSGQRAGHAGHQPHRPQVDVLVERAAELQQAAPQRDVVGHHVGPADGAEVDGVEAAEFVEPVVGQHLPVLDVVVGAGVVEVLEVELQVEGGGCGVEHAQAFGDDFGADAVAGDDGDAVGVGHVGTSFRWSGLQSVDGVVGFAAVEDVDDGVGGGQTGAGTGLDGLAGQVGGDDDVVEAA